jgi:hypothetical protein
MSHDMRRSIDRWRWLAPTLVGLVLAVQGARPSDAQAQCGFQLGFATLRNLVGPQAVGQCLENERFNSANGNAEQRTTGGLLVWRKADNWTAFTDGFRTWVNGPAGVQVRLNGERFPWEADAQSVGRPAPSAVVERFLGAVMGRFDVPDPLAADRLALTMLSRRLRATASQPGGLPLLLGVQNTTPDVVVRDPVTGPTPDRVTVPASLLFSGSGPANRNFQLIQEDGEWRIDAVTVAP